MPIAPGHEVDFNIWGMAPDVRLTIWHHDVAASSNTRLAVVSLPSSAMTIVTMAVAVVLVDVERETRAEEV